MDGIKGHNGFDGYLGDKGNEGIHGYLLFKLHLVFSSCKYQFFLIFEGENGDQGETGKIKFLS